MRIHEHHLEGVDDDCCWFAGAYLPFTLSLHTINILHNMLAVFIPHELTDSLMHFTFTRLL